MLAPDVSVDSRIPYVSLPHNPLNLLDGFSRRKDVPGTVEEAESFGDEAASRTPRLANPLRRFKLSEFLRNKGRQGWPEHFVEEAVLCTVIYWCAFIIGVVKYMTVGRIRFLLQSRISTAHAILVVASDVEREGERLSH